MEHLRGGEAAGQDHLIHFGVRDQMLADLVVGGAGELDESLGHPGCFEGGDRRRTDRAGLGCGLEDRSTAGGECVHQACSRDREREVPRPGDEGHRVRRPRQLLRTLLVLEGQA